MELLPDEAYYWVYANNLDWGYLDHPPMVAFWIFLTKWIPGEIGVRLFMVAANLICIYLIEKLVQPKSLRLFYLIVGSLVFIHFGFLAVPDVPLVVFSVFFLLRFKSFLEKSSMRNSILLALAVALMMYSKYQGLILVFLAVASQWRMITKRAFYLVLLFSGILFLPHLIWQYANDWPSHYFHLHERSPEGYSLKNTLTYPFEQILAFGPLIGVLLLIGTYKFKPKTDFERTLKFIVFGLFVFLLLMTFKGPVELNWSAIAIVALIYTGYWGIEGRIRLTKVTKVVAIASLVLLVSVRLLLTFNPFPDLDVVKRNFGNEQWAISIKEKAGKRPVVFQDSYQLPSLYSFYYQMPSSSINSPNKRMNQYDLYEFTDEFKNDPVVMYSNWSYQGMEAFDNPRGGKYHLKEIEHFISYEKFQFFPEQWVYKVGPEEELTINLSTKNPAGYTFLELNEYPKMYWYLHNRKNKVSKNVLHVTFDDLLKNEACSFKFTTPKEPGKYSIRLSLKPAGQFESYNSKRIYVVVE